MACGQDGLNGRESLARIISSGFVQKSVRRVAKPAAESLSQRWISNCRRNVHAG